MSLITETHKVQLLIDTQATLNSGGKKGNLLIERKGDGRIILRGELGRADSATSNNRLYPREVLNREIDKLQTEAKSNKLFGELDHPADGRTQFQRVSHIIRDIAITEDGRVMGEVEVLNTAKGRDLAAIIEAGGAVGFSSRGTGTTHKRNDGVDVVNGDYTMLTYDAVADPAHSGAYPEVFFEHTEVKNLRRVEGMPNTESQLDETLAKNPKLKEAVEQRIAATLEKERKHIQAEEQERLKEQFENDLLGQVQNLRKEVEENVRDEVLSDPTYADAKRRLEAIQAVVGPMEGDAVPSAEFQKLESTVQEQTNAIESLKKELAEAIAERDKIAKIARESSIKFFLEKKLAGHPMGDLARRIIMKEVDDTDTAKDIEAKVESTLNDLKKFDEHNEKKAEKVKDLTTQIREEIKKETESLTTKIEELEATNAKLRSVAEKSISVAKEGYQSALKTEAIADKIGGHPARNKLKRLVEDANLNTPDEVSSFLDKLLKEEKDSELLKKVRDRVKKGTSNTLNESGEENPSPLRTRRQEGIFGYSANELQKLAGIQPGTK